MKFDGFGIKVLVSVAMLWVLPVEVKAAETPQPKAEVFSFRPLGKENAAPHLKTLPVLQPSSKQVTDGEPQASPVLFEVEGVLADGDDQLDDESLYDVHQFEGEAGQIVRITLTSDEFDTFLWLQAASGEELTLNNNGGEGRNSEIVFRLPSAGEYRLLASAYDSSGRGAYQLTVVTADEQALRQAEADSLFNRGIEAFRVSQYQPALELWHSALEKYRELNDRHGEANLLGNLGLVYRNLGEYEQAIDFFQQQLFIAKEIGDFQDEANSLGNLGLIYFVLSEYERAVGFLQQSSDIAREIGDRQSEANALGSLGIAYFSLGEYERAIDFQQQSLDIAREIGDRQGEMGSLNNLGSTYSSLGEYEQAIDFQQQSLDLAREIGDRQDETNSLSNLGNAYSSLGEYKRAIDFQQQSLDIAREIGDLRGEAYALGSLGVAYDSLSEYKRAIDFLQSQLTIVREIGDRQGEAYSLGNLGNAYRNLGEYEQAIDFQQQSLDLAREISDLRGEAFSLTSLGISYLFQQKVALAEDVLLAAISMYEQLRTVALTDQNQISFFETQISAYRNLETALILQNEYETALEISERGRTQAFVRLLSERLSTETENQEIRESPDFEAIQAIAKAQNSTLVEYSLSPSTSGAGDSIFVWIVQPTGELYFEEVPLNENSLDVSELIKETRESMDVRGRRGLESVTPNADNSDASDELRELHQLLIDPIKQWLPTDPEERVVFIPQGQLFLVPFPALQDGAGTHLIEKHTILTTPSIQVLDLTERQATAASGATPTTEILTVGNPVMPEVWDFEQDVSVQLSSLDGAEREAQAIATFFNTEALIGAQATEEAVKQQIGNARIVHLATHGLLEYGIPEESGVRDVPGAIALTPTDTEDGLLTASEIIEELTLQAELVVLSACDTGLGTITGDGVIGLSRSLIAAGTPSVIVSLWAIPDAPTAELMTDFYSQRQQRLDKAQALRQTMLETMKTHPNPINWAAFTLIGEAD